MKDILDRELHDFDLVAFSFSRGGSDMRIGMWFNEAVYHATYFRTDGKLTRSPVYSVCIIHSRDTKEFEIYNKLKNAIHHMVSDIKAEKERKEALKRIPAKELEVYSLYQNKKGRFVLYLGYGDEITTYENSSHNFVRSGYISIYNHCSDKQEFYDMLKGKNGSAIYALTKSRPFLVNKICGPICDLPKSIRLYKSGKQSKYLNIYMKA